MYDHVILHVASCTIIATVSQSWKQGEDFISEILAYLFPRLQHGDSKRDSLVVVVVVIVIQIQKEGNFTIATLHLQSLNQLYITGKGMKKRSKLEIHWWPWTRALEELIAMMVKVMMVLAMTHSIS